MKIPTRELVYMSLFVAIHIVLSRIASIHLVFGGVEYTRIGLGAFPVILGGLLLGPRCGMIIGALGDFVGYQLNPMGPYVPFFTAIAALNGFFPGLLFKWLGCQPRLGKLVVIVALTQILCSVVLTPYTLWAMFGIPPAVTVPQRMFSLLFTVPIFAYCLQVLYARLSLAANFRAGIQTYTEKLDGFRPTRRK